ncbi:hypothetical protein H0H87_008029, partial [Tephrocybe sp. NHM501043]
GMAPFMVMHLLIYSAAQHCVGYNLKFLYHVLIIVLTQIEDFSKTDDQKFHMANLPKPICKWFLRHFNLETLSKIKSTQFCIYFDRIDLGCCQADISPLGAYAQMDLEGTLSVSKPTRDPLMDCCNDFIHAIEDAILNYIAMGIGQDSRQAGVSNTMVVPEENPVQEC